jgi:hypothetical protein
VCLWLLLAPAWLGVATRYVLAIGSAVFLLGVFLSVLRPPPGDTAPRGQLPGAWAGRPTPLTAKRG